MHLLGNTPCNYSHAVLFEGRCNAAFCVNKAVINVMRFVQVIDTLKTPSCPWSLVPGSRFKFGNWTTVPSLHSWNITECDVKPQPTNLPKPMVWLYGDPARTVKCWNDHWKFLKYWLHYEERVPKSCWTDHWYWKCFGNIMENLGTWLCFQKVPEQSVAEGI